MKKIYTLFLTAFIFYSAIAQQQILLFTETFENATNGFNLTGGGVGSNTGTNNWIVNNQYTGAPVYPLTPPQDSVVSGTINGAPNSKYLHIHDENTTTVNNCNWSTTNASDHFAFTGSPFCTLGMTNVIFTFFWICEGVPGSAYGEVYYRINGGPWTKTGQAEYRGQTKWKYEVIQDPAFNNAQNLQLGFRWVNPGTGGNSNIAFGVDDIIAVGTYDPVNNPTSISVDYVSSTNVCQGDDIVFSLNLQSPLCDGQYYIELSDQNGNFGANPGTNQYIAATANDTVRYVSWTVPSNLVGNCFKLRWHRLGSPDIVGSASVCIRISDCPETITTASAPVITDADTACLLSVIDVKFNSIGVYGPGSANNIYTAQLSDTNGLFTTPVTLGTLPSDLAYPSTPGNISGLIPASVPPGCGYYIRVVSSIPAVTGTLLGPFCLVKCDELTNDHRDIQFCIPKLTNASGLCNPLKIHPNQWNTLATYDTCNSWTVELRSMMNFSLVNSGGLGVYRDSIGGTFNFCVPSVRDSLPVPPGAYYMRIVSNCSNQPWNQTGSVIRVTIGAPDTIAPSILFNDTVVCNQGQVNFFVNPFHHPPSDYIWNSNFLAPPNGNVGDPFPWEFNPLTVNITPGTPLGEFVVYVREKNYGCLGPQSSAGRFTLITTPRGDITGPVQVCLGDTVSYFVDYQKETYYNWTAPDGITILDEANSEVRVIFDTLGTFNLSNFSLNKCGSDSGVYNVKVVTLFNVNAGADKTACEGDTISLTATSGDLDKVFITSDTATVGRTGSMFNIIAHEDVIIDSFAVKYLSTQTVNAEIYGKQGSYRTFEQNQFSWNQLGGYFGLTPAPLGQMTVIPYFLSHHMAPGDTFAFYVTTQNGIKQAYSPGNGLNGTVFKSDGIIDFVQGSINDYPFGAFTGPFALNIKIYYSTKAGLSYYWSTGDTSATIYFPAQQSGIYSVSVQDTSGCKNRDSVLITVNPKPDVDAGPDTLICGSNAYTMQGISNAETFEWTPADGLSATNILTPVWSSLQAGRYYLQATDAIGCGNTDSVYIDVIPVIINAGPDTTLCDGETYLFQAMASGSIVMWSPSTGLSAVDILNPQFNNAQGGEYILTATDPNSGCTASDTVKIEIGACDSYIKAPGAFTPNGQGENNYFTVFAKNIEQYEIRIFNRWGEVVYNSRDVGELNDLNRGWDGTFNGKPQQTGTFIYFISARDRGGKTIEKKGNLTLIR